jgi:head-tail adaptor
MIVGRLNRRISIQTQSTTTDLDAFRQPLPASWSTAYTCWAGIDIQASQLLYSTAEFMSKVTHRITARWTSSFTFAPNQRIVYTEATTGIVHTYEINAVLNDKQRNRQLILMCYELDAEE